MHQLIYTSSATAPFQVAELRALLNKARSNNVRAQVTGMLVFANGKFFQVLEGARSNVDTIYDKITQDPRHNDLRLIARLELPKRDFTDWSMGFVTPDDVAAMPEGFNNFMSETFTVKAFTADPSQARRLMLAFRLGNWRERVQTGDT